ncbi:MAG: helix-turn-helix domain-containing protein [Granulosicoccus sp.]
MTSLPTLFVVAFLLVILAASNYRQLKETPTGKVFSAVIYLNALSMVLIGLRWSWDLIVLLPIAATLAIISLSLLYLAFRSLGRHGPVVQLARDWVHFLPATTVVISAILLPRFVDLPLIMTKLIYTGLLIQLARRAPDSLQLVRLSWLKNSQQALLGAALLTVISTAVDIAITIDFALYEGRHAANLVGFVSLFILLLLGWVSVLAGRGRVSDGGVALDVSSDPLNVEPGVVNEGSESRLTRDSKESEAGDSSLLELLNRLLIEERLYADTELNLQRLARKAGVPARIISKAINTHTGQNMSQWVNSARINAACDLLNNSDVTITQAMVESGFLTKSNFNREFRRIKGCSPSEWRESKR